MSAFSISRPSGSLYGLFTNLLDCLFQGGGVNSELLRMLHVLIGLRILAKGSVGQCPSSIGVGVPGIEPNGLAVGWMSLQTKTVLPLDRNHLLGPFCWQLDAEGIDVEGQHSVAAHKGC